MPKIPDDMSDEAKARRAAMHRISREGGERHRLQRPAQADGSEMDRVAASLGLEPGAIAFLCSRGR